MNKQVFIKPPTKNVRSLTDDERRRVAQRVTENQFRKLAAKFAGPAQRPKSKPAKTVRNTYLNGSNHTGATNWDKATFKPSDGKFQPKVKSQGKKK